MKMIDLYRGYVEKIKKRRREEAVLKACGCYCRCPYCHDILNDQADCVDDTEAQKVYYRCNTCGMDSVWTFDAFPVPHLLQLQKSPVDFRSSVVL